MKKKFFVYFLFIFFMVARDEPLHTGAVLVVLAGVCVRTRQSGSPRRVGYLGLNGLSIAI